MSSYKISDSKGGLALQVEYTKKLSLEEFLDRLDVKQFYSLTSEERESDGKMRSSLMINLRENTFHSCHKKDFLSAPSFGEAGLVKRLLENESIVYDSEVPSKVERDRNDPEIYYTTISHKVYRPKKGKKCLELYKEYMKSAEDQPSNVNFYGNLFEFRWEKDKIYASINPMELMKNAKKAYKKFDKRLYKMFNEHLPPFQEVMKQEIEKE